MQSKLENLFPVRSSTIEDVCSRALSNPRKSVSVREFHGRLHLWFQWQRKGVIHLNRPATVRLVIFQLSARCSNLQSIHVLDYLETNLLLSDTQFEFRHSRSTADLLAYVTEQVSRSLEKQGVTRSVPLDISKAFDRVCTEGSCTSYRLTESKTRSTNFSALSFEICTFLLFLTVRSL